MKENDLFSKKHRLLTPEIRTEKWTSRILLGLSWVICTSLLSRVSFFLKRGKNCWWTNSSLTTSKHQTVTKPMASEERWSQSFNRNQGQQQGWNTGDKPAFSFKKRKKKSLKSWLLEICHLNWLCVTKIFAFSHCQGWAKQINASSYLTVQCWQQTCWWVSP